MKRFSPGRVMSWIDDLFDETETAHFHSVVAASFEREIESYGIADGMYGRPVDPAYAHEPAYLAGHRISLRLPVEPGFG